MDLEFVADVSNIFCICFLVLSRMCRDNIIVKHVSYFGYILAKSSKQTTIKQK